MVSRKRQRESVYNAPDCYSLSLTQSDITFLSAFVSYDRPFVRYALLQKRFVFATLLELGIPTDLLFIVAQYFSGFADPHVNEFMIPQVENVDEAPVSVVPPVMSMLVLFGESLQLSWLPIALEQKRWDLRGIRIIEPENVKSERVTLRLKEIAKNSQGCPLSEDAWDVDFIKMHCIDELYKTISSVLKQFYPIYCAADLLARIGGNENIDSSLWKFPTEESDHQPKSRSLLRKAKKHFMQIWVERAVPRLYTQLESASRYLRRKKLKIGVVTPQRIAGLCSEFEKTQSSVIRVMQTLLLLHQQRFCIQGIPTQQCTEIFPFCTSQNFILAPRSFDHLDTWTAFAPPKVPGAPALLRLTMQFNKSGEIRIGGAAKTVLPQMETFLGATHQSKVCFAGSTQTEPLDSFYESLHEKKRTKYALYRVMPSTILENWHKSVFLESHPYTDQDLWTLWEKNLKQKETDTHIL